MLRRAVVCVCARYCDLMAAGLFASSLKTNASDNFPLNLSAACIFGGPDKHLIRLLGYNYNGALNGRGAMFGLAAGQQEVWEISFAPGNMGLSGMNMFR